MATTKTTEEELEAAQSRYSTEGLDSKDEVQQALTSAQYTPSQTVTDAAAALKEWQENHPDEYQSSYQSQINSLLEQALGQGSFRYNYAADPLYRQYAQSYTQNAYNASTDAAAQAAALTGGYGSSYAVSAAQQAYQQQMNALSNIIPTLYSLALDSYNAEGDRLFDEIELVSGQEQYDQDLYYRELEEYYNQLDRKGDAYNQAYAQDYAEYTDYLAQLDDLRDYYVQQEQYNATLKQQRFNNVMTVLGLIGDGIQLALSGTTGLGSLANGLLQTGYNMYANNRDYEAERADAAWSQQMQELLRQDSLNQQAYDNTTAAQEYQDALAQQAFDNDVTSQKLAIAQAEWALKQAQAQAKATSASTRATSTAQATANTANSGNTAAAAAGANNSVLSYTVARLKAMGKTNQQITSQLAGEGYSQDDIAKILAQLNS